MLIYYRLSCHAADKASEKLLSPSCTAHRHTFTGKINVLREAFTLLQCCPVDGQAVITRPFLGCGSCQQHLDFDSVSHSAYHLL